MQLRNIIIVADNNLTMALYARKGKKQLRFNFKDKCWDDDTMIDKNKLITVGEFRKTRMYDVYKTATLLNWSTMKPSNCTRIRESNEEFHFERNFILNVSIDIS